MANADRTCSVFFGLGDGKLNRFVGIEYAYEYVKAFDDMNFPDYLPGHPHFGGVMYWDKGPQPSSDPCLPSILQEFHGKITPQVLMRDLVAVFQTGDLHIQVTDPANDLIYVANAGALTPRFPNVRPAYNRQFTMFNMTQLFAQVL